jgi:S-adenosylmethionine:tRNA ribosyltransferase-isomerase
VTAASALDFSLPPALEATEPPEARGLARDEVRLLVARRGDGAIEHHVFRDLPDLLSPGDLVVVNTSATVAAAIGARRADGRAARLHVAMPAPDSPADDLWLIELRSADGASPASSDGHEGERLTLDGGAAAELLARYAGGRLWLARVSAPSPLLAHLAVFGRPIRYGYVRREWPLADYETVYADQPGSAEMPSAGRPFTPELITRLTARGILVAPVVLHTGVSSPERHEPPVAERYEVPAETARLVNAVRWWGGRVIAVGTTVVRALETVASPDGCVEPAEGWTSLVVTPARGLYAVDGLITGWHEPLASHLDLLEASAGRELLGRSYDEALAQGYLWHEFGDSHLVLP